jgi:hypothetical protein
MANFFPIVTESGFVILSRVGKLPSMAACQRCGLKFFLPMPFDGDANQADELLWQKFFQHKCKPEFLAHRSKMHIVSSMGRPRF